MSDITPGPWIVAPASGSGLPDSQKKYNGKPYQEHSSVITSERSCQKGVAHIYQGYGEVGSPEALSEQLANAHLIAAAPDLLEACELLMAAVLEGQNEERLLEERVELIEHAGQKAMAAIAKARGKEAE